MKEYIKPFLEISSLTPESDIAYGDEFDISAPNSWIANDTNIWQGIPEEY